MKTNTAKMLLERSVFDPILAQDVLQELPFQKKFSEGTSSIFKRFVCLVLIYPEVQSFFPNQAEFLAKKIKKLNFKYFKNTNLIQYVENFIHDILDSLKD